MSDAHWSQIYEHRAAETLPWHEPRPSTLPLVTANSTPDDAVIDVGGGTGLLAAQLLGDGYHDITVLDVSTTALDRARRQLGVRCTEVEWIHADITSFDPDRTWDVWHDRAVFHFLTTPEQRAAYRFAATKAISPSGLMVISTFAPDGPAMCAGLPVCRYDVSGLAAEFSSDFDRVSGGPVVPPSDQGDQRPYTAVVLRRRVT